MHPVTEALMRAKVWEGYQAFKNGQSEDCNPYAKGTDARVWWNAGFIEAMEEGV